MKGFEMRLSVLICTTLLMLGVTCEPALAKTSKNHHNPKGYYDTRNDIVSPDVNDPWEGFNPPIFDFNVAFAPHLFKPLITAYDYIPHPVRHSVSNFLSNLSEPLNV